MLELASSTPARLAVTAVLLAVLAARIDWAAVERRLRDGRPGWLLAAIAVVVVALLAGAWRWGLLLRAAELPAGARPVLRGTFMGAFANNFLPTGFGGDAVRALSVARRGPELARAATTVIADRATALTCLLALGWLTLPFGDVPRELVGALVAVTIAAGVVAALVLAAASSSRLRERIPLRARPALTEMGRALGAVLADGGVVARVTALGLAYQLLIVLSVWLGARSIGLELAYPLIAVTVPLVLLLTLLPVSLAGFGVREGSYAVLLGTAGVSTTDATMLSLITVLAMAVASLPGAVALAAGRRATT